MFHVKHPRLFLLAAGLFFGCSHPLPDANSPAAQLYADRCGGCHRPYDPRSLTSAMWRLQVEAMRPKMAQAGIPLSDADSSSAILAYLQQNSAKD
jgi:hypothetical protein